MAQVRFHNITAHATGLIALLVVAMCSSRALAVQVQDLVRIKGSEQSKLVGMGLVVGLPGTGDGGKFAPAMRPLATLVQHFLDPNVVASELADAKNVALVSLTSTLPASGVREGDHVDVHVSAIGPAKSLVGGRLFLIPMTGPLPGSPIYAFAEGALTIENPAVPTTGVVKDGAQLTRDVFAQYVDKFSRITLVVNDASASWTTANNLANLVNDVMVPGKTAIAKAIDPRNVVIDLPLAERANPSTFISDVLKSYIDPSQVSTGAKVVINERTGTIVVSGEVQISPVLISHKGLTITTVTPQPAPTESDPRRDLTNFVGLDPEKRGGSKLADLLEAFNQLKVEAPDRIAIIKEIYKSGKLHAQLVVE